MENERAEGKRFWNYVEGRLSSKSLLHVPEISGYIEEEKKGMKGEGMKARDVLRAIEKSIGAFGDFVQTDNTKSSWWQFRSLLWIYCSPVEDPKDLDLLADLTKQLQKKELMLKDIQRKKKCWLKRAYYELEESQRREIFFCTIDMKLVARVLKMSLISTPQLKWCQDKLNNIEFNEGRVAIKASTTCLFPP
ncbi:Ribosomal protein L34Ae [Macleaya cordata]|uniref:Ribosomal protein L34Ae n=1 Tax=Macleaya cordata TaxID=56857 RepID=A0A200QHD2_MACCD|nr:Ribosomal protein L34Ae [Macleaya cordata]